MILGAFYLMITSSLNFIFSNLSLFFLGLIKVGGLQSLFVKFGYATPETTIFSNSTCGLPRKDYFNLVRDIDSDFPWPGMSLGLLISSVWYWCSE